MHHCINVYYTIKCIITSYCQIANISLSSVVMSLAWSSRAHSKTQVSMIHPAALTINMWSALSYYTANARWPVVFNLQYSPAALKCLWQRLYI